MLNINTLLDIFYYDGDSSSYSDNLKMKLGNPGTDKYTFTLKANDALYIGYSKPVHNLYFDFITSNTNPSVLLNIEYSNSENGYTSLGIYDETSGFARSGLIQWEEVSSNLSSTATVNGVKKYWLKITPTLDLSEVSLNYIGLLFSTDDDLVLLNPYILESNLLMGERNHLKAHVAARNEIVQTYSNKGYVTTGGNLDFWDMLNINEFRQGATFLALSYIYFNLSDNEDDMWLAKSETYRKRYKEQIDLYYSSIDIDNDGVTDASEKTKKSISRTMGR